VKERKSEYVLGSRMAESPLSASSNELAMTHCPLCYIHGAMDSCNLAWFVA
jgi:hypothetical protein